MDFDFIRVIFNSDVVIGAIICFLGILYIGWLEPALAELKQYREKTHKKIDEVSTIEDIEKTVKYIATNQTKEIADLLKDHNKESNETVEHIINKFYKDNIDEIIKSLNNGIKFDLEKYNQILTLIQTSISESDDKTNSIYEDMSKTVTVIESLHKLITALIKELEEKNMISHIDRDNLNYNFSPEDINNVMKFFANMSDKTNMSKVQKILRG